MFLIVDPGLTIDSNAAGARIRRQQRITTPKIFLPVPIIFRVLLACGYVHATGRINV
jgi:hypothetical protein